MAALSAVDKLNQSSFYIWQLNTNKLLAMVLWTLLMWYGTSSVPDAAYPEVPGQLSVFLYKLQIID